MHLTLTEPRPGTTRSLSNSCVDTNTEKMLTEEMMKILVYLKGFSEEHRQRLAQVTALWVGSGLLPQNTLQVIINEHQVKEGVALDFMLEVLRVIKTEKGATSVLSILKKSGLDNNLDQLFPSNKRTAENIRTSSSPPTSKRL